ncbi:SCP2 sterol-binding domain-containing protein [Nocardia concava]|uniref:SCP2 sterol-binding domain-containing protein n=1 Tax=Nocardia concava TaxID=257281 RepID=UPI0002FFA2DA|nr:SCP2 sterol-binding domain-containing protein [Nocardia concava]
MLVKDRLARANAHFIAGRSPAQLAILDRGPVRRVVLATLPTLMRLLFDESGTRALGGDPLSGTLELNIRRPDGTGVDPFEIAIRDGGCTVSRRSSFRRPDARVTIGLADMVRMGSGAVDPGRFVAEGMADGRISMGGDPFLFLAVPNLFRMANRKLI